MKLLFLSLTDLLLARQWLFLQINSTKIDRKFINLATKKLCDVDKELWERLISHDTPWGQSAEVFVDDNFKKTLDEIRKKKDDE